MEPFDRAGIASRIRGLLSNLNAIDRSIVAASLGVDATSLHMSIDEEAPYPTIDVIAAVIRAYGVDPRWLLTGEYDTLSHRNSLELTTDEMPALVTKLVSERTM